MEIKQEFYYIKNFDFKSNLSLKLRWNRKYLNIFKLNSYFKKPFLADYSWSAILAFQHYSVTLHNTALTEPKKKHTDFAIRRKELLIVFLCGWPACWGPKMGYDVNRFQGRWTRSSPVPSAPECLRIRCRFVLFAKNAHRESYICFKYKQSYISIDSGRDVRARILPRMH